MKSGPPYRLAILASGKGSNLVAIAEGVGIVRFYRRSSGEPLKYLDGELEQNGSFTYNIRGRRIWFTPDGRSIAYLHGELSGAPSHRGYRVSVSPLRLTDEDEAIAAKRQALPIRKLPPEQKRQEEAEDGFHLVAGVLERSDLAILGKGPNQRPMKPADIALTANKQVVTLVKGNLSATGFQVGPACILTSSAMVGTDGSPPPKVFRSGDQNKPQDDRAVAPLQHGGNAAVVRMELVGARSQAIARGADRLEGRSHYLTSADPGRWITHVPQYARVELPQVYRGIDLAYYGNGAQLEYDFIVAPRAEPRKIAIAVHGASRLEVDGAGQLLMHTPSGVVAWKKPVAYQDVAGTRRAVRVAYDLRGANHFGFRVGNYDRRQTLVIDPVLAYSTLLGGTGGDHANAIAVDASGSAFITGQAGSSNFPSTSGAFPASGGVFVAKLNPAGTALEYSTFLGPGRGTGVALQGGNAYVTGAAPDTFPVTPGAYDDAEPGENAFVAKLTPDGSGLVYSALLGGGLTQGAAIAACMHFAMRFRTPGTRWASFCRQPTR